MIAVVVIMPDSQSPSMSLAERPARRPFVVITGLSGAGRLTALHVLEDLGYVAVDNVPLPLLGDLMRSTAGSLGEMAAPLAFGIDTRTYGFDSTDLVRRLQQLRQRPDFDTLDMPALMNALIAEGARIEVLYVHGHWRGVNDLEDLRHAVDFAHAQAPFDR